MPFKPGESGNPLGATKERKFYAALTRSMLADDGKKVRAAAEQLLDQAAAGEPWAIKELADRLDGRPAQAIIGDSENPLLIISRIERAIIDSVADRDSQDIPALIGSSTIQGS